MQTLSRSPMRPAIAAVLAALVATAAGVAAAGPVAPARPARPNIVVVLTDDQTYGSLPHDPPVMPYLQGQIEDPAAGWTRFPNAFVNTPLCCPSRATILTGRYSHRTGVQGNNEGADLDESTTLATWLQDAGYRTALIGKYLNEYPFDRGPYVPPGWDRFVAKENSSDATVYGDYTLVEDGLPRPYGSEPADYATDVLARAAVDFITSSPPGRPFFLLFAPSAPHRPWEPAPRHVGAYADLPITDPPSVGEADVSDKPAWIRALPRITPSERAEFREDRRDGYETLLGVDDAMRSLDAALRTRRAFENTIVIYLTDNGYSLGEHRWESKSCPYDPCVRVPFLVRDPSSVGGTEDRLVSNVDVAPTVADLANIAPGMRQDGSSLAPSFGTPPASAAARPRPRSALLLEFAGGGGVPGWWAARTRDFLWVELTTGERELYDLTGVLGPPDPHQLDNRAGDPGYATIRTALENRLEALRAG